MRNKRYIPRARSAQSMASGSSSPRTTPFSLSTSTIASTLNSGAGGFHLVGPIASTTRNHTTTASIGLAALLPQTGTTATILLAGTSIGDIVTIGFPSLVSVGLAWGGYVNNAGTVTLNAFNMGSGTITPNAGTYRVAAVGYT